MSDAPAAGAAPGEATPAETTPGAAPAGAAPAAASPWSTASTSAPGLSHEPLAPQAFAGPAVGSLWMLLLFSALIAAGLWLLRRLAAGPAGRRGHLALLGSLNVGPRERVAIVRIDATRRIVVGITGGSMSLLAELDPDAPPAPAPAPLPSPAPASEHATAHAQVPFSDWLQGALARHAQHARDTLRAWTALLVPMSLLAVLMGLPDAAHAQAASSSLLSLQQSTGAQGTTWSMPVQTLLVFTAMSFLPAVVLMMTSFTRIVIVLSLVRQAIGLQSAPPNQVVIGMALFLSAFVMGPTLDKVHQQAYVPYNEQRIDFNQAVERGSAPVREFMLRQTRATDLALFARLGGYPASGEGALDPQTAPLRLLVPAFVISELKTAFQIGFMVFIPFILIDLICASLLMSLGMMMVSPVLVALPFKMILFVLADGWNLLVGSLVASFGT